MPRYVTKTWKKKNRRYKLNLQFEGLVGIYHSLCTDSKILISKVTGQTQASSWIIESNDIGMRLRVRADWRGIELGRCFG
jgi:hypothetical protein